MSHEVDILAVGDKSQSGDAFALRFGDLTDPTKQKVVIIDGGFKDSGSGEKLVERINKEYQTNHVDLVISTHPDQDHISGLTTVLEKMDVDLLWMHRPWAKSEEIKKMAEDRTLLAELGASKFKKSLEQAYDLEKLAEQNDVAIEEPFQGKSAFDGVLNVLGPSEDYYLKLAGEFEKGAQYSLAEKAKRIISEFWHKDELVDPEPNAVGARNNSSVILLAIFGDKHFLFCGDAGVEAITLANDYALANGYNIANQIHYFHVPHHGSKRNLGPTLLDSLMGPIQPEGYESGKVAFISAAVEGGTKHPSPRVINALIRRGVKVSPATCGSDQCYKSIDRPTRPGWGPIVHLEFINSYEEED